MSAYVIDEEHAAYLAAAAESMGARHGGEFRYRWGGEIHREDPKRIANRLVDECVRSVRARYPDDKPGELPGPVGWDYCVSDDALADWRYQDFKAVEVLKALSCYEYQTCETDDWRTTRAYAICEAIRDEAIRNVPGYDAAPWGAPERPDVRRVSLLALAGKVRR